MILRKHYLVAALISAIIAFSGVLAAQESHRHASQPTAEKLGTVRFPVSCNANMQAPFERGIALLHSFGYNAAVAEFHEIETEDPSCAMAYWGEAMSLYRQLWDRPTQADLERGASLIRKAQQVGAKTARERGYVSSAAAFYLADPKATYEARVTSYSNALASLHQQFPDDDEAAVFYALSHRLTQRE